MPSSNCNSPKHACVSAVTAALLRCNSFCMTSANLQIWSFHLMISFSQFVTVFAEVPATIVKWEFHLTISISQFVTVFAGSSIQIIKWDVN